MGIGRCAILPNAKLPASSKGIASPSSGRWTPQIPTGLTLTVISDTVIQADWTNVDTNGDGAKIEIRTEGGSFSVSTVALGITTYQFINLIPYTLYYVRIRAYKGTHYSSYSSIIYATTLEPSILSDGNTVGYFASDDLTKITKDVNNAISQETDHLGGSMLLANVDVPSEPIYSDDGIISNSKFIKSNAITLNQPTFIYEIIKQVAWTLNKYIQDGVTMDTGVLYQDATTPNISAYAGTSSADSSDLVLDTWGIIRMLFNGVNSKLIVNKNTPITGNFGTGNMGGIAFGGASNGSGKSNIKYRDRIVRKISDTAPNEEIIYNYLKKKLYKVPAWSKVSFTNADIVNTLSAFNMSSGQTKDIVQTGSYSTNQGSYAWVGFIESASKKLYGIPFDDTRIMKLDLTDDSVTYITSAKLSGTWKFSSAVLANNGFIYCIPGVNAKVVKINTANDAVTDFGSFASIAGAQKWGGSVMAPNGCIYSPPLCHASILKIDPLTDTTSLIGSFTASDVNNDPGFCKWGQAILAPNGKIYCPPFLWTTILKIDPSADTSEEIGTFGTGYKWYTGVCLSNGIIYFLPYNDNRIMKLDTNTDTVSYIVTSLPGGSGAETFSSAVLSPSGKIYGMPFTCQYIMEIDPSDDSIAYIGNFGAGEGKYQGGILTDNGIIYSPPYYSNNETKILKFLSQYDIDPNLALSRLTNRF